MASGIDFTQLCTFDSGRYSASVDARHSALSDTYTYTTFIHCDAKTLLHAQLKHQLEGVGRMAGKGGTEWLSRHLAASGVSHHFVNARDFQDSQMALRTSEKLIGRFAEHGHEAVLNDPKMLKKVGLEAQREATRETRAITRQR
jgi:hypothetical protein